MPPEALLLVPLALAAGVELHLTLLVLVLHPLFGSATPLPDGMVPAAETGVLLVVGCLYCIELAAEQQPVPAHLWHGIQAVARPVAATLIGASLLSPHGAAATLAGGVAAGATGWLSHAGKRGLHASRWIGRRTAPAQPLVSAAEDVVVLGFVVVALERPTAGAAMGGVVLLALLTLGRPLLDSARFGLRVVWDLVGTAVSRGRWTRDEDLSSRVRASWEAGAGSAGGRIRGARAAALGLPDRPGVSTGWLVIGGAGNVAFAVRGRSGHRTVVLGPSENVSVEEGFLGERIRMERSAGEETVELVLTRAGPGGAAVAEELRRLG